MSFLDKIKVLFGTKKNGALHVNTEEQPDSKKKSKVKKRSGKLDIAKQYELDKHAFNGTMSQFRVARDFTTGNMVGFKFLDIEKAKLFENRFIGLNKPPEGEIALKMSHESIVETYEVGTTTFNQPYILMEYINGPGLDTLINQRSEELIGRRISLIKKMAAAVRAVHDAGFIHRDICPRNFICDKSLDWLKLIDFGLTIPDKPEFKRPGNRTGTPLYMAPEIVRRRATDHRVDIFAFGVTCYRILVFDHPWSSRDTTGKAALKHDTQLPTPLESVNPKLNKNLVKAIMTSIEADPGNRPETMDHFLRMIRNVEYEEE